MSRNSNIEWPEVPENPYRDGDRVTPDRRTRILKVNLENGSAVYWPWAKKWREQPGWFVGPGVSSKRKAKKILRAWLADQKANTVESNELLKGLRK